MFVLMHNGKKLGFFHSEIDANIVKHRWATMYEDDTYEVVFIAK